MDYNTTVMSFVHWSCMNNHKNIFGRRVIASKCVQC